MKLCMDCRHCIPLPWHDWGRWISGPYCVFTECGHPTLGAMYAGGTDPLSLVGGTGCGARRKCVYIRQDHPDCPGWEGK